MSCKVIAVGNLKGGTGKSTVAVNLASSLSAKSKVLLIDCDAQGTAGDWATRGLLPVRVIHQPLEATEKAAQKQWTATVIKYKAEYDFIVLDLPPHIGATLSLALLVSEHFVVPVTASGADLKATAKALELMRETRKLRGDDLPRCLIVPSRVDRRTASGREIEAILHDFGEPVAPAIGQRSAHVDAFSAGEWIGTYAPRSSAHDEIEAVAAILKRAKHGQQEARVITGKFDASGTRDREGDSPSLTATANK
jgi:chromosome partitioning protein